MIHPRTLSQTETALEQGAMAERLRDEVEELRTVAAKVRLPQRVSDSLFSGSAESGTTVASFSPGLSLPMPHMPKGTAHGSYRLVDVDLFHNCLDLS